MGTPVFLFHQSCQIDLSQALQGTRRIPITMAGRNNNGEGPIWYRKLVMENDADGKKPPTDGEKTAGPGMIEFYKIVGEELEGELQALQARVKKIEAIAPGSPKHIKLLQLYVDKLDEKIQKGVEANMEISARTIETLRATNTLREQFIGELERINKTLRGRIIALEATNNILRQALNRDTATSIKKPTPGIE